MPQPVIHTHTASSALGGQPADEGRATMDARDERHLRNVIEVAKRSREHGNHPFAALLVGPDDQPLLEAENTVVTERDCTDHAETNLMRLASTRFDRHYLSKCTVYASTKPCAMCAGAMYWARVRRIAFALDEAILRLYTGDDPENPTMDPPCREVFVRGQRNLVVLGPALLEEALAVHEGFWKLLSRG